MSDIRVRTSSSNVSVRVGQENAVKILSSTSGGSTDTTNIARNVIGGIASVTDLNVSGITTLSQLEVTGITTVSQLNITGSNTYGIAYVDGSGYVVSTESSTNPSLTESNLILTTNESGVPSWSNAIDGGTY